MESLPSLSLLDAVGLLALLIGALRGLIRGLSREFGDMVTALAAFAVALRFHGPFGEAVAARTRLDLPPARAIAFALLAVAAIVILAVCRLILRLFGQITFIPLVNRAGGLLAGLVRSAALLAVMFAVMNLWPHEYLNRTFGEESALGALLLRAVPALRELREGAAEPGEEAFPGRAPADNAAAPEPRPVP